MGVDYLYCGSCGECYNSDCFNDCNWCESPIERIKKCGCSYLLCNDCDEDYILYFDKRLYKQNKKIFNNCEKIIFCEECLKKYKKLSIDKQIHKIKKYIEEEIEQFTDSESIDEN